MLELHPTQFRGYLLPWVQATMREHMRQGLAAYPLLETLISTYEQFSPAPQSMLSFLEDRATDLVSHLNAAVELSCIPRAKFHLRNKICGNTIALEL